MALRYAASDVLLWCCGRVAARLVASGQNEAIGRKPLLPRRPACLPACPVPSSTSNRTSMSASAPISCWPPAGRPGCAGATDLEEAKGTS